MQGTNAIQRVTSSGLQPNFSIVFPQTLLLLLMCILKDKSISGLPSESWLLRERLNMKRNKSRTEHTSTVPVCSKFPSPRSTSHQQRFPLEVCPIPFCIIYTLVSRASQNHRIIKIGKDHWKSSHPASLLKQGPLKRVTQDFVQMGFEYLLERRFHNLSACSHAQ